MSNLTRGGVAYDFNMSPYRYNVDYGYSSITYVFSSNYYLGNFVDRMKSNRDKINQSLSRRFGFTVNNDILCDLKLYSSIEKRGFLIYKDGERFECLSTITLDGVNLTTTN